MIKSKEGYEWTSQLHYSNIGDKPPSYCGIYTDKECGHGTGRCVVNAIQNYTEVIATVGGRIRSALGKIRNEGDNSTRWEDLSPEAKEKLVKIVNVSRDEVEAMKFFVHFVGDIHQPLHLSERDEGGNKAKAKFDGKIRNLHEIWDTRILAKRYKTSYHEDFATYLDFLLHQPSPPTIISKLPARKFTASRLTSVSTSELPTSRIHRRNIQVSVEVEQTIFKLLRDIASKRPVDWANQINQLNCLLVWKYHQEYNNFAVTHVQSFADSDVDLGGQYYLDSVPVIEWLLKVGGERLAGMLNTALSVDEGAVELASKKRFREEEEE
ncbi:S1/P1 nuclease-domain-containing protein [Paraphysoderma sedebokerense]|nr:S1/P1 nuclease-domain-containing protein [Paraphysoderma sedebokerense]